MTEQPGALLDERPLTSDAADDATVVALVDECLDLINHSEAARPPATFRLSVVMPVYNEARWIRAILSRVCAVPLPKEIVIVDDMSRDGSREILAEIEREQAEQPDSNNVIRVVYQPHNRGKGASLRTGFAHITGDVVVVQDADLEYFPEDYPALVAPLIRGDADVVFGSRYLGETRRVLNFWHCLINRFLTVLSNVTTGLNLTDMETCYKVFRTEVIRDIAPNLKSDRFGFEPEVTAAIARRKLRVYETPVRYAPRGYAEGKKIGWKDGVRAIACIVGCYFRRKL
ncbi:MAG TPA: glycosyltransferase family 2 protein [Planctomycetaceae bacterium]|nr:glycosyltransferase family 2 protein [Planctomycetaceae bacterium]